MKEFILKLTCLVLLPLGLFFGSSEIYFLKQGNSYTRKKEIIESNIHAAEIIALGSSHGLRGINTDVFDKPALNLANVSQDLYYDDALLRKYLPEASKLKTVFITVSPFTLDFLLETSSESWRTHFYKRVFDIGRLEGQSLLAPKDRFYTLIHYDRLLRYLRKGLPNHDMKNLTETGFSPTPVPDKEALNKDITPESGKKRAELHYKNDDGRYRQNNVDRLENLIKHLREENIEVYLITLPAYKTYASAFDKQWLDGVFNTYKRTAEQNHASYLNLFHDSRFEKDDFYDNDHLNEKGATKFSRILIKKLEK